MSMTELIFGPHGPQMFIAMMGFLLVSCVVIGTGIDAVSEQFSKIFNLKA